MLTEQEQWWRGEAGNAYLARNRVEWHKRVPFWRHILGLTQANSILEVGCNAGWNLRAIKTVDNEISAFGVEINERAREEATDAGLSVFPASAAEVGVLWPEQFDLTFTAGVLIHISPSHLREAMFSIAQASNRWVLAVEYEADQEQEINYRGESERLWKRPFGELYAELGLTQRHKLEAGDGLGFDNCVAWLLEKA